MDFVILGIGEWGFRELPFEEHCRIASKFGFKYLELGMGGEFKGRLQSGMTQAELDTILECIREYGLKTPFMCLENDFTKGGVEEVREEAKRVCRAAKLSKSFGVTHLRLFAGFTPLEEMTGDKWDNMIRAFQMVEAEIRSYGMVISIETHGALFSQGKGRRHVPTVSTNKTALKRMLGELPAGVGINFDPGNLRPVQSDPVISYLDILNGRINYCHLKDWLDNGDGSWTAAGVGDGDMPWPELLAKTTFDGIYLIEYEPVHDVEDGIRRSLRYLRSIRDDIRFE